MNIVCLDDALFPQLLDAWRAGKPLGRYTQHGKTHIVRASSRFLFVAHDDNAEAIMFEPARTMSEAELLAKRLFESLSNGNCQVEIFER